MILLQISATHGPEECGIAAARALHRLLHEAGQCGVDACVLEQVDGASRGTLRSALLSLDGDQAEPLAGRWTGTIQWICASPCRPRHPRKNWFIGVARCAAPAPVLESAIRFEAMRASGPGGQHVNKTASAIRATHLATGISVRVQTERSQHANKRLAIAWIAHRLAEHAEAQDAGLRAQRRQMHHEVERGKPVRIFRGGDFVPD
ncbi:peptide chain release factor [Cupriavidus sp. YR651]|uniref:peptide chain release factor H n=1 Tax=Cupriavidus sp. YR651 TaxID=1855315 RepID=UPI000881D61D|nr:peptide chain release factor H [Cupriavidus sp. YR651]SDC03764.1 peptide chain release factor [Cupriavidus sp. YR651]